MTLLKKNCGECGERKELPEKNPDKSAQSTVGFKGEIKMTTKENYTTEEWNLLITAPPAAATYIMTADMSAIGAMKEMRALSKALNKPNPPANAQELVTSLTADIQAKTKNKERMEAQTTAKGEDAREPNRQTLRDTAVLLNEKCTPEEAAGFKQWLLDIAQSVAEADKEGSHFGIGGVRVTEKEEVALSEIKSILNM